MTFNPGKYHRRSIRLPGHDYGSPGAYFVTIVTRDREQLFGQIADHEMYLNTSGQIVREEWERTPCIRPGVEIDAFVVMPNHAHLLVVVGAHSCAPLHGRQTAVLPRPRRSLGSLVACFKATATRRINEIRGTPGAPVWQRNYHEHIIRDETEFDEIRQYILENPLHWDDDPENLVVGAHSCAPLLPAP
jgi:putative transposase